MAQGFIDMDVVGISNCFQEKEQLQQSNNMGFSTQVIVQGFP